MTAIALTLIALLAVSYLAYSSICRMDELAMQTKSRWARLGYLAWAAALIYALTVLWYAAIDLLPLYKNL